MNIIIGNWIERDFISAFSIIIVCRQLIDSRTNGDMSAQGVLKQMADNNLMGHCVGSYYQLNKAVAVGGASHTMVYNQHKMRFQRKRFSVQNETKQNTQKHTHKTGENRNQNLLSTKTADNDRCDTMPCHAMHSIIGNTVKIRIYWTIWKSNGAAFVRFASMYGQCARARAMNLKLKWERENRKSATRWQNQKSNRIVLHSAMHAMQEIEMYDGEKEEKNDRIGASTKYAKNIVIVLRTKPQIP